MARILIVDDDVELANDTAALIRQAGHEVATINATDDAYASITENPPDLAILDVMFPDNPVAGFDLARRIRRTTALKALPVILLTDVNHHFPMNFSAKDIDPDWMPVQDFLTKPVNLTALLKKVDELLKKS